MSDAVETDPLEAMVDALSQLGRRELEAWLERDLTLQATPAERRAAELGVLAEMLSQITPEPGWTYAMIEQAEYDARRPPDAPSGRSLSESYGSWKRACKAAYGLKPDGRTLGRSHHAWPHHPGRGQPRVSEYIFDEVIRAVRRCGLELACRPTSTTYMRWSEAKRRLAREHGLTVRIPSIDAVYRHFPANAHFPAGGRERWRRAVTEAALTDEELRDAYARRMRLEELQLTAADELDSEAIGMLRQAGITEQSIELIRVGESGKLRLSQAVLAARTLDYSLAYLARTTSERGLPPAADVRFDHELYKRRREEVGLAASRVREMLTLSPRDGRRLALGTYEPTIAQITLLEQLLQLPQAALITRTDGRDSGPPPVDS
jgi:hypothetical protein